LNSVDTYITCAGCGDELNVLYMTTLEDRYWCPECIEDGTAARKLAIVRANRERKQDAKSNR
jgi:uncharacterized protein CbrC (UPF0167 family)